MGLLNDSELRKLILADSPLISSSDPDHPIDLDIQLQPASVDLRLSNTFQRFKNDLSFVDCIRDQNQNMESFTVVEYEPIVLQPGEFLLTQTIEHVNLSADLIARVEARQSIARLGIMVNLASYINPGYEGVIPLQIINLSNHYIVLRPFWRVCTLIIERCESNAEKPYNIREDAKYQYEELISPSKLAQDYELLGNFFNDQDSYEKFFNTRFNKEIETIPELKSFYKETFLQLAAETIYLSKSRGHKLPEKDDIEDARKNIAKILKHLNKVT